jgi:hypothetical protein
MQNLDKRKLRSVFKELVISVTLSVLQAENYFPLNRHEFGFTSTQKNSSLYVDCVKKRIKKT